jgi:hypothetical protein
MLDFPLIVLGESSGSISNIERPLVVVWNAISSTHRSYKLRSVRDPKRESKETMDTICNVSLSTAKRKFVRDERRVGKRERMLREHTS